MAQRGLPFGSGMSSPALGLSSDEDVPGTNSPEGVQQFERMFEDAVNVREELEDALSEFMLMGDKAKLTLEEELARMEEQSRDPDEEMDEAALREELAAARKIVEVVKIEQQQTEARLEQVLDDAEALRIEADDARREREALEQELTVVGLGSQDQTAAGELQTVMARMHEVESEAEILRRQLESRGSLGEGSQRPMHATEDHPGDLFVEQVLWPKFQDLTTAVSSIQAFLAAQGQEQRHSEGGAVVRLPRITKRVKVARDKGSRDGELGRVMDDAEDMRVDLENALTEFLGSGSIDALQVA